MIVISRQNTLHRARTHDISNHVHDECPQDLPKRQTASPHQARDISISEGIPRRGSSITQLYHSEDIPQQFSAIQDHTKGLSGLEEAVRSVPLVPQSKKPISLARTADLSPISMSSQSYDDALLQLLRKHHSDLQLLFHQFQAGCKTELHCNGIHVNGLDDFGVGVVETSDTNSKPASDDFNEVWSEAPPSEQSKTDVEPVFKQQGTRSRLSGPFVASWQSTKKSRWEMFQFRIWSFLEQPDGGWSNHLFHNITNLLIAVSVASPVMATAQLPEHIKSGLNNVDIVFTILFTIELLIKVICYPDRKTFLKSLYSLIDFAVVFAGFLGIALAGVQNIWLDLIRTQVPILRLLKITRHSSGWRLLMMSMRNCVSPLLVPLYLMLLMIVFTGSLHFWIDNVLACKLDDCPELQQPAFKSIPHAMWFVLVSLSTVGYGDVTPHTDLGKLLACFQIVMGLCYMAMPLAIIGNNFSEIWQDRHRLLLRDKLSNGTYRRDIAQVKKLFYTFDDDKSGTIALNEFLPFVESLEMGLSKRVIHDLFRSIDLDGSGIISFTEFADFVFPDAETDPTAAEQ